MFDITIFTRITTITINNELNTSKESLQCYNVKVFQIITIDSFDLLLYCMVVTLNNHNKGENNMTTEAEFVFKAVMESPEGTKAVQEFESRKKADSFRTRLYRAKSALKDFSVEISVDGNVVTVKKSKKANGGIVLISPEGKEVNFSFSDLQEKEWKRIEAEIRKECKELGQSQLLVNDLIKLRKEQFEVTGR